MEDCQISELKEYSQDGHIFQIISAGENLILRASTREEMNRWVQVLFQHTFIQSSENAIFVRIDEQIDQVEHKKNCLREIFYDDVCSFQTFITHKTALTDFKSYLVRVPHWQLPYNDNLPCLICRKKQVLIIR